MNQELVESLFCINKEKPMSTCHGQCHLQKTVEQENSDNTNLTENRLSIEYLSISCLIIEEVLYSETQNIFYYTSPSISQHFSDCITPPPEFV